MTDMTYDPEADAIYIRVGSGKVDRTEEAGPFIYDLDVDGRILGIEILSASTTLAPGDWKNARLPAPIPRTPRNDGLPLTAVTTGATATDVLVLSDDLPPDFLSCLSVTSAPFCSPRRRKRRV